MTDLKCPKCLSNLRSIERNGVTIDHCAECGGVYLDRGELEQLIQQENRFLEREARYRDDDHDDDDHDHRGDRGYHDRHDDQYPRRRKKKKRRSFLEDMFDFG